MKKNPEFFKDILYLIVDVIEISLKKNNLWRDIVQISVFHSKNLFQPYSISFLFCVIS